MIETRTKLMSARVAKDVARLCSQAVTLGSLAVQVACGSGASTADAEAHLEALLSDPGGHVFASPNGTFVSSKVLDSDGVARRLRVLDTNGAEADPSVLIGSKSGAIRGELLDLVETDYTADQLVSVLIGLQDDVVLSDEPTVVGDAASLRLQSAPSMVRLNGKDVTLADLQSDHLRIAARASQIAAAQVSLRLSHLKQLREQEGWSLSDSSLEEIALANGGFVRTMRLADVERFADENHDILAYLELAPKDSDTSLATAMVATHANPGAAQHGNSSGSGIGVWLTEGGCPPSGFITNYTWLVGSDTDHSRNTTSIVRAVAPDSWIYCSSPGPATPTAAQLNGSGGHPRVYITTRSAGDDTFSGYQGFDRDWDNFVLNNSILSVQAAGNNNSGVGNIASPGKALNVMAIGNYVDATSTINATSSWRDPTDTANKKPELSAPGTSIDAGGVTMTGTSQATPHVAGLMADAMQAYWWLQLRPAVSRAYALSTSTDVIAGGADHVGVGGIDYDSAYYNGHVFWWDGSSSSFPGWAANDSGTDSSMIEITWTFSAGQKVQAALAWLTSGSFTLSHLSSLYPIGQDLDLYVYGPGGSMVTYSFDAYTAWENVSFTAPTAGVYTFKVNRFSDADTATPLHMALMLNF